MTEKAIYGDTNPVPGAGDVQRFGSVIGLNPQMEQRYRELHANTWESVTRRLTESYIRNYSIYITELAGKKYLFSYFEYTGSDFEADMQAMADDPETQRWWRETRPCQIQLPNCAPGANWTEMECLFYLP